MPMMRTVVAALLLGASSAAATAPVLHETEAGFDDIATAVEDAIINAGLVIDTTSHVGEMLARTKADVGSSKDIYTRADVFTFCSAAVSREVMEADPLNIQYCPYSIFLYETADEPGKITVGHPSYGGSAAPAQELLDGILADALMLE